MPLIAGCQANLLIFKFQYHVTTLFAQNSPFETPIKLSHLLEVVPLHRLDAVFKYIYLPLKVLPNIDDPVHCQFEDSQPWGCPVRGTLRLVVRYPEHDIKDGRDGKACRHRITEG